MKNKMTKFFINLKNFLIQFGWLLIIIVPVFLFINWAVFSIVAAQKDTIDTRLYSSAESDMRSIDLFVNSRLTSIHDDIHVILNSDEGSAYRTDPNPVNTSDFQALLYRIASSKIAFKHMIMTDTQGDILYQTNRISDDQVTEQAAPLGSITSFYYYPELTAVDAEKLFISKLYIKDNQAVITFIKPIVYNDTLMSYLIVDYDANDLLSVLDLYASHEDSYFQFGILNSDTIWHVDQVDTTLHIDDNPAFKTSLFDRIIHNHYVLTYQLELMEISPHFYVDDTNELRFFVLMDESQAIEDSESVFLKNALIIAISANLFAGILVTYIAYMSAVRKDDRLLINANMHLSIQNQDSIIIVNHSSRIVYVNPAFEKIYGYSFDEIYLNHIDHIVGVGFLDRKIKMKHLADFESHSWSKTKSGIFMLNFLRVKEETFFARQNKHYICILTNSKLTLDHYKTYMDNKENVLFEIERLFQPFRIEIDQSTLFSITITHVHTITFANFLRRRLDQRYFIAILEKNQIFIYVELKPEERQQAIAYLDHVMELYRYEKRTDEAFTHQFVVAYASEKVNTMKQLIEAAIASLSYIKTHNYLKYQIYQEDIKQFVELEAAIESELENGFKKHEFYLDYQIIKDLEKNKIVGVEALLRWQNERLGRISPADFIPVIERSFYINQLTPMVLDIAIKDFESIRDDLDQDFTISINLSLFDINNDDIIDALIKQMVESRLPSKLFSFEITEKQYINQVNRINQMIDKLHEYGISVSVDDFGSGHSSMKLLREIKVDIVKIDRSYIKNFPAEDDGKMLETLLDLVKRFEKPIVVEGVENLVHLNYCIMEKIKYVQGYYIAKPMRLEAFHKQYFIENR